MLKGFKTPKHNKFDYNPRYWNPRKEDLEERLRLADPETASDPEVMKTRISNGFRRKGGYQDMSRTKSNYMFRRNMLLLGIIVFLLFVTFLLVYVYLPQVVNALEGNSI